jgi:hypothetical protein
MSLVKLWASLIGLLWLPAILAGQRQRLVRQIKFR